MTKGLSRAGFDIDLRQGQLREQALVKAMLEVGYLVEHKRDHAAKKTGRVFIEHSQHGRPSGIATTTAHFWAIEFDERAWFLCETDRLRWLWQKGREQGYTRVGGDFDAYEGVAIPLTWLTRVDYLRVGTAPPAPQEQLDHKLAAALRLDEDDADLDAAWLRAQERIGLVVSAPEVP